MPLNWLKGLFNALLPIVLIGDKRLNNVLLMRDAQRLDEELSTANFGEWLDFHSLLVDQREAQGLTQKQVADRLRISQPAVAQFEKSTYSPSITTIIAYATAIGVKLNLGVGKK
jgi:DNA-binding XRE family transcriptional regulator